MVITKGKGKGIQKRMRGDIWQWKETYLDW